MLSTAPEAAALDRIRDSAGSMKTESHNIVLESCFDENIAESGGQTASADSVNSQILTILKEKLLPLFLDGNSKDLVGGWLLFGIDDPSSFV